jgi:hypothetical protein
MWINFDSGKDSILIFVDHPDMIETFDTSIGQSQTRHRQKFHGAMNFSSISPIMEFPYLYIRFINATK